MTKVVFNNCFGGFSLSDAGVRRYAEIKGITLYPEGDGDWRTTYWTVPPDQRSAILEGKAWDNATQEQRVASNEAHSALTIYSREIPRTDPALVQVVEEMGAAANGDCAELRVAEIPDGSKYRIDEYDGNESVMQPDDYEWTVA